MRVSEVNGTALVEYQDAGGGRGALAADIVVLCPRLPARRERSR